MKTRCQDKDEATVAESFFQAIILLAGNISIYMH